ncbi:hypothetical protein [Stutzerimonas nitrititolerans]|uniref:hypothetical protein n=1 Tax=Stutzerimonas nitrititolerans TaxID=2482751 RepID=UPI0028ADBDD9|nr:hypothetical protein [Stutzerimonas nitrititolerans]
MSDRISICKKNVDHIYSLIDLLLSTHGDRPLPRADRQEITNFETNYKNFKSRTSKGSTDTEAAVQSAYGVAVHAQALGLKVKNRDIYSGDVKSIAEQLIEAAKNFKVVIDSDEEFAQPYKLTGNKDQLLEGVTDISVSDQEKQTIELLAKLRADIDNFERRINQGLEEIERIKSKGSSELQNTNKEISKLQNVIESIGSEVANIDQTMRSEVEKAAKISQEASEYSERIHSQIDELLGHTASKVLLSDYAETARNEKKTADLMRNLSLACMGVTGAIICYAIYESISLGLDWGQAIFKFLTAVFLSVPAAYLARESAKHRSQEHSNRKVSLDLRAITPYIATMTIEEQNKIKAEIAAKIFGNQEGSSITDNYPLNIQELAKLIIEKIPAPNK